MPFRICFIASEIAPLAKTGGLADVAGALGRSLHANGHDIRLFMPRYGGVDTSFLSPRPVPEVGTVTLGFHDRRIAFSLLAATLPGSRATVYLVECPELYERPRLYSDAPDEHLRFLVLQRATIEACQRLGFAPDIMHCNDWHTALIPLLLRTRYAWDALFASTRTLLTIHNIGYQGVFPLQTCADLPLDAGSDLLDTEDRAAGHVNWLRQGIRAADAVSTVSPTYAHEICTPAGGHGLDATLRARRNPVTGILNGVDYAEWNPATDRRLPHHYDPSNLAGKRLNKQALLARLGLGADPDAPLAGIVSRLTVQKGLDLLFDSLPACIESRNLRLAALGAGDARYERFLEDLAARFPGRVAFHRGYDEDLAHLIEAGSDLFLMPSLYEPCGLNQMYSLKYGTVPIVRRTGGLADSVQMWNPLTRQGTGIVFNDFDTPAMRWALGVALDLYADRSAWQQLMRNGMAADFSWTARTRDYERLYASLSTQRPEIDGT